MALSEGKMAESTDPYELIEQAEAFEYGTAQRAGLLDRAVALADRTGDVRTCFDARMQRLWSAIFGGELELSMALFAWCQHTADSRTDVIDADEMLWTYKLMAPLLPLFARIPQARIDGFLTEMVRRFTENGVNQRPLEAKCSEVLLAQGKVAAARIHWEAAMRVGRDEYADCPACELDYQLSLLLAENRFEDLLQAARPIMEGRAQCAEVPHRSLPRLMQAMVALNRPGEAEALREHSYAMVRDNRDFIQEVALHVEFLVCREALEQAAGMVLRHLPWLQEIRNDKQQFHFTRAVHCVVRALADTPAQARLWREQLLDALEATYGIVESTSPAAMDRLARLTAHVAQDGQARAQALDARNGNNYFQRQWQEAAFVVTAPERPSGVSLS